jgi:hypothetical protein
MRMGTGEHGSNCYAQRRYIFGATDRFVCTIGLETPDSLTEKQMFERVRALVERHHGDLAECFQGSWNRDVGNGGRVSESGVIVRVYHHVENRDQAVRLREIEAHASEMHHKLAEVIARMNMARITF